MWRFMLKPVKGVGVAKASFKKRNMCHAVDPKPGDLSMSRVISREIWGEARTGVSCNLLG